MADGMKKVMASAVLKINTEISEGYAFKWATEGMNKLAMRYDSACAINAVPLEAVIGAGVPYALPTECIGVAKVFNAYGVPIKNYVVDLRNRLILDDSGTYQIDYLSMPTPITALSQDPSINALYWDALGAYVALSHLRSVAAEADGNSFLIVPIKSSVAPADTLKNSTRLI